MWGSRARYTALWTALAIAGGTVSAEAGETLSSKRYRLDIPSADVEMALIELARRTDHSLIVPSEHIVVERSNAIHGQYSLPDALALMLKGTGLTGGLTESGVITIAARTVAPKGGEIVSPEQKKAVSALALIAGLFAPTGASHAEVKPGAIEEIVVTAQKRTERLKDVPISITVLSGATLDKATTSGVFEEVTKVPGVVIVPSIAAFGAQVAIRGVSAAGPGIEGSSPIGYYLDTVPFGFIRFSAAPDSGSFDLERVEVLRGPQGTLYGASSEAGVVRVISKEADLNDFDLKARGLTSGTDGGGLNYGGDLAVNIPIVRGKLAVRGVVDYQDMSGWIDKQGGQKNANDSELRNYRAKINAKPTDELSIGLSVWLSRTQVGGPPQSFSDRTAPYSGITPEKQKQSFDAFGAKIAYQFPYFSLSSSTSYLDYTSNGQNNGDLIGFTGLVIHGIIASRVFSEELVLNSPEGNKWRWTAGAFYRDVQDNWDQYAPPLSPTNSIDKSKSYAFFGQIGRRFLDDKLELSAGLRQFHDDVSNEKNEEKDSSPPPYHVEESFNATTPRVVLSWYPNKDVTAYASYSEGFRSGLPQYYTIAIENPTLVSAKPDLLKNYELGVKADLLNHRLALEAALYFMKWKDVQQSLLIPYQGFQTSAQVNGSDASGPGLDISATLHAAEGLNVGASFSWNDLTLDAPVISLGQQLFKKGDRLNYSSEYTGAVFLTYDFPLGSATGQFSTSANFISKQYTHQISGFLLGQTAYSVHGHDVLFVQASFTVNFTSQWSAKLYADNITNEYGSLLGPYVGYVSPAETEGVPRPRPRTIGLELDYRFR